MLEGGWFSYSMRGKPSDGEALSFASKIHKEYVIYVEDLAHRSVLDKDNLAEYVYGPLEVGNCYFVTFSDDKMFLDHEYKGKKRIEICWYGKFGGVYSKPDANSLYFNQQSDTNIIDTFLYNQEGDDAQWGRTCEIHQDDRNQIFLRLASKGELKRVIVTYEDGDYGKESPYIKIEKVEGFFESAKYS